MSDDNGEEPEWESHCLALENSGRPEDLALLKTVIEKRKDLKLLGIRHTVEEPELVELLRRWNSVTFGKDSKVLNTLLPADMEEEEKEEMKEVIRKWNSNHTTKCEYLQIQVVYCTMATF